VRRATTVGLAPLALGALFALAGCGGGGTHYSFAESKLCLESNTVSVSEGDADYVAQAASEGGLYVKLQDGNSLNIAFDRTSGDASRTRGAYKAFASGLNVQTSDVMFSKGSVTMVWDQTPTSGDRQTVENCLKSG
jgi:hypothetical protein